VLDDREQHPGAAAILRPLPGVALDGLLEELAGVVEDLPEPSASSQAPLRDQAT
jgi:hypothetical protein